MTSVRALRASFRHLATWVICTGAASAPTVAIAQVNNNAAAGQQVFRFETFGNERFWTDAVRMPQGMAAARFTPLDALKLGLQVDSEAIPPPALRSM